LENKINLDKNWSDKNVLITGASGFVGGALLDRLISAGANTVCLVRDYIPKSRLFATELHKKTIMANGALEDYGLIRRILSEYEIQVIFHVGAQTQVLTALADPLSTFHTNIMGSCNILEAARNCSTIETVVVSSSDKAYGIPDKLPYTEDMPLRGAFPYEVSKSCVDLLAHSYFQTYGMPISISRCGNTYGEGDLNFRRLIPKVIKYIRFDKPLVMRSEGTPLRDFVYLADIVEAYMLLGTQTKRKGVTGEAFNFSSGKAFRVSEVVDLMLKLMDTKVRPQWTHSAEKEIPEQYLAIEKAGKILGWKPKYDLESGLKRTIAWYDDFFSKNKHL
jgi:CDP-glucose 4,6-dehydratase